MTERKPRLVYRERENIRPYYTQKQVGCSQIGLDNVSFTNTFLCMLVCCMHTCTCTHACTYVHRLHTWILHSPSLKRPIVALPRGTPRISEMPFASSGAALYFTTFLERKYSSSDITMFVRRGTSTDKFGGGIHFSALDEHKAWQHCDVCTCARVNKTCEQVLSNITACCAATPRCASVRHNTNHITISKMKWMFEWQLVCVYSCLQMTSA